MKQHSNKSAPLSVLISFKPNKLLTMRNPIYPGLSVTQRSSPISCLRVSGGPFTSLQSDKGCCPVAPKAPTADLLPRVPLLTKWRWPLMTRLDGGELHMVCILHLSPPHILDHVWMLLPLGVTSSPPTSLIGWLFFRDCLELLLLP